MTRQEMLMIFASWYEQGKLQFPRPITPTTSPSLKKLEKNEIVGGINEKNHADIISLNIQEKILERKDLSSQKDWSQNLETVFVSILEFDSKILTKVIPNISTISDLSDFDSFNKVEWCSRNWLGLMHLFKKYFILYLEQSFGIQGLKYNYAKHFATNSDTDPTFQCIPEYCRRRRSQLTYYANKVVMMFLFEAAGMDDSPLLDALKLCLIAKFKSHDVLYISSGKKRKYTNKTYNVQDKISNFPSDNIELMDPVWSSSEINSLPETRDTVTIVGDTISVEVRGEIR